MCEQAKLQPCSLSFRSIWITGITLHLLHPSVFLLYENVMIYEQFIMVFRPLSILQSLPPFHSSEPLQLFSSLEMVKFQLYCLVYILYIIYTLIYKGFPWYCITSSNLWVESLSAAATLFLLWFHALIVCCIFCESISSIHLDCHQMKQ